MIQTVQLTQKRRTLPDYPSRKGYEFGALSHAVIGACIDVQRQLGVHCMEVDYQRVLELALPKRGLQFQREIQSHLKRIHGSISVVASVGLDRGRPAHERLLDA